MIVITVGNITRSAFHQCPRNFAQSWKYIRQVDHVHNPVAGPNFIIALAILFAPRINWKSRYVSREKMAQMAIGKFSIRLLQLQRSAVLRLCGKIPDYVLLCFGIFTIVSVIEHYELDDKEKVKISFLFSIRCAHKKSYTKKNHIIFLVFLKTWDKSVK